MDVQTLGQAAVGAITGGAITGIISWIKMGMMMAVLSERQEGIQKEFDKCQISRDIWRQSERQHREVLDKVVTDSLAGRMDEMNARLGRIEVSINGARE